MSTPSLRATPAQRITLVLREACKRTIRYYPDELTGRFYVKQANPNAPIWYVVMDTHYPDHKIEFSIVVKDIEVSTKAGIAEIHKRIEIRITKSLPPIPPEVQLYQEE